MASSVNSASRSSPFLLISNREMRLLVLPDTNAAIKNLVVTPRYVRPDTLVENPYWAWNMRPSEEKSKFIVPGMKEMIREQTKIAGDKNRSFSGLFTARDSSSAGSSFLGVGSSGADSTSALEWRKGLAKWSAHGSPSERRINRAKQN